MARRERLHSKLAEAILRWMPGTDSALVCRKSITRDDLASSFQIRLDTTVTLADWEKAIEVARKLFHDHQNDSARDRRIHLVEGYLKQALNPAARKSFSEELTQLRASH
jgi:hypothetical protein